MTGSSKHYIYILDGLRRVAGKIQVHVLWVELVHAQKNTLKSRYPPQTLVEYHSGKPGLALSCRILAAPTSTLARSNVYLVPSYERPGIKVLFK